MDISSGREKDWRPSGDRVRVLEAGLTILLEVMENAGCNYVLVLLSQRGVQWAPETEEGECLDLSFPCS